VEFNSVVVGTGTATAHVSDTITNAAVNLSASTVFEHVAKHHEAEKQLRIPPDLVASGWPCGLIGGFWNGRGKLLGRRTMIFFFCSIESTSVLPVGVAGLLLGGRTPRYCDVERTGFSTQHRHRP
jgi:hypothetical protein